jgi:hypothetical protein
MKWIRAVLLLALVGLLLPGAARATALPPELKAYDFAEAYYIEDVGIVISPYPHGFYCPRGTETPEGIRVMPGQTFYQYDSSHQICEEYRFLRLAGGQAFFHERLFHYQVVRDVHGRLLAVRGPCFDTDDFYLTQFRGLEWADHVFANVDLHPGLQEWRSKNYFSGLR